MINCGTNEVYSGCASNCDLTDCVSKDWECREMEVFSACICAEGHVRHNGQCVPYSQGFHLHKKSQNRL